MKSAEYIAGLQSAVDDCDNARAMIAERGRAEWLPGIEFIQGWLEARLRGLRPPVTGPDTSPMEPSETPAPGDSP